MLRWRRAGIGFAMAFSLGAQQPPTLHNNGQPMRVEFACAAENLDWAGLACSDDEPCSIYLELSAIAPAGKKLFLGGDLHAESATLASVLLASDDGGLTWKEPAARVRGATLDQLQFYDLEHGWAGGEMVYPLPRDPFFLITTDGGQSWRNRAITDEGGPGSIQRFAFDSQQHGEVIVDAGRSAENGRFRRYESDTGGDSWNLRAAADAPPKTQTAPRPADPDFRISTGKNVYRIEKRESGKWSTLAQFEVAAATCKSPSPQAPPAPPEPEAPKDQD